MAKRIFIAFAKEDEAYRNLLAGQAKLDKCPFEFVNMSLQEPYDEKWKTNCRIRIKGCDGLVALISKNTAKADGELWEIQCGYDEEIPVMLMWVDGNRPSLPTLIKDKRINVWSWDTIKSFIDKL